MKVYISGYRSHWLSPYTILEKVLFWKDWDKIEYDTPWVEKWVDRLDPCCKFLHKFLDLIHPRIIHVKIDKYDTWSMDSTLSHIILPMLLQLKETKHGAPYVDDEDVPAGENLRSSEAPAKENEWDVDENHFKRWDWVLDQMIWSFEQILDDKFDSFRTGESDIKWVKSEKTYFNEVTKKEESTYEMVRGPLDTYKFDEEGYRLYNEKIENGLKLFGKYYRSLWD